VLIELGSDLVHDTRSGIVVSRNYEEADLFKSRVAKVVKAPKSNYYLGDLIHPYMNARDFGPTDQKYTSRLTQRTTYFDVPIEIQDGDQVLIKHVGLSQKHLVFDGYMIVKYDNLIARIDGEEIYPLNGAVFLEMDDDERGDYFEGKANEFGVDERKGIVKKEGCLVKNYLLFPESKDFDITLLSKRVFLTKGAAARIEYDEHQAWGKNRARPLYATFRHFINAYAMTEDVIL